MLARKSVLIVSAAPSNLVASIATELASRGHFAIFASASPCKYIKAFPDSTELQTLEVDTQSPLSLSQAAVTVTSALRESGFSGLDVLINDVGVGSSLALLDFMMDETPEKYDAKVSIALSLATIFAGLLTETKGKVVNLSSSGTFVSAPCMNKTSHFSAERAISGISKQMRLEPLLHDVFIETVMLQCVLTATQMSPKVIFPEGSPCQFAKSAISWWKWGSSTINHSLEPMYSLILKDTRYYDLDRRWSHDGHSNIDWEDGVSRLEKGLTVRSLYK